MADLPRQHENIRAIDPFRSQGLYLFTQLFLESHSLRGTYHESAF